MRVAGGRQLRNLELNAVRTRPGGLGVPRRQLHGHRHPARLGAGERGRRLLPAASLPVLLGLLMYRQIGRAMVAGAVKG